MSNTDIQKISKFNNIQSELSDFEIKCIASKFGTPVYVIEENILRNNVEVLRKSFNNYTGKTAISYSFKSNFNPSLIQIFIEEGLVFDLSSIGEIYFFLKCGGDVNNIIYTSVTEEKSEYVEVLKNGINKIVIGSFNGYVNLNESAKFLNVTVDVLVRINPEIYVNADISASFKNGKFGVPMDGSTNDSAKFIIHQIYNSNNLIFNGIHFHLGTQIIDPSCFINTIDLLDTFINELKNEISDFSINIFDIGGGMPVEYTKSVPSPEYIGALITDKLNQFIEKINYTPTLIVESGRFLSAESSILISKIVNKKTFSDGNFLIIDSGYHLLLDSALMKHKYPIDIISKSNSISYGDISIGGRLCDSLDVFQLPVDVDFPHTEINDLVVFRNVGAYSIVFNMPFHCQTKPMILLYRENKSMEIIRNTEKIEDLFRQEGGDILIK